MMLHYRPGIWKRRGGPRHTRDPGTVNNTSTKYVTINLVKRIKGGYSKRRTRPGSNKSGNCIEATDTDGSEGSDVLDEMDCNELLLATK